MNKNEFILYQGIGGKEGQEWVDSIVQNKIYSSPIENTNVDRQVFIAKEDLGSKDAIKINKTKNKSNSKKKKSISKNL